MERKMLKGACLAALAACLVVAPALAQQKAPNRAKNANIASVTVLPRSGAGQAVYFNTDDTWADLLAGTDPGDGLDAFVSLIWEDAPSLNITNGFADDWGLVGTERTLVRYRFTVCDNMDVAGGDPATYTIDSALYPHILPHPTCSLGGPDDAAIPGSSCQFTLNVKGDGSSSFFCEEVECKVPPGVTLPDDLWIGMMTDVDATVTGRGPATLLTADVAEMGRGVANNGDLEATGFDTAPPVWRSCLFFGGPPQEAWMAGSLYADPAGACCIDPANTCVVTSAAGCADQGGKYRGDLSSCGPDLDGDGVLVRCDNCVGTANPGQEDCNGDDVGDACEADTANQDGDGDGVCNGVDPCPLDNPDDTDGDTICDSDDACPLDPDNDKDGDGICGDVDTCPNDADNDKDGDGICGDIDICPNDADDDKDGDGQCCGNVDECCNDPDKVLPGQCGCNIPDTDDDGDGVANCNDICPGGNDAIDTDSDGVPDFCDRCPLDAPNDDTDGDTICNSDDLCPGADDLVDADGNAIPDCLEAIPTVSTWGLVVMTLLLLVAWKVYFGRRQQMA